ncbi:MAG TPA: RagB/SusD family nutrient uptake outer membrane protein [Balneolales bacterium]|nr:RagB/SusD family nutrient uptake outer membrane protein [Balneolales bacterium]
MDRKDFLKVLGTSLFGGAAFFTGCSNILNQNNPNSVTPSNFWQNSSDAEANVTAIYQNFLGQAGWASANNWYDRIVPSLYRGDLIGITHDVSDWWSMASFTLVASNGTASGNWSTNYTGIFYANQAIQNIPNIKSSDTATMNRLVGEAKFLRAYFYFDLLNNFKNIPIILTVPKDNSEYSVPQSTPDQAWSQIIKDLKDAAAVLPTSYDAANLGRVTKGAALGFLGKSYLYQGKWQDAVNTFEQIINSGTYALLPNFADVFLESNDNSEESLLEVQYSTNPYKGQTLKSPRNYEEAPSQAGGWYEEFPNQFVFNEMSKEKTTNNESDPRLYATIGWKGSPLKIYGKNWSDLMSSNMDAMIWRKYSGAENNEVLSDYSGKNWRILRFADILLMHAEALNNLGKTSSAVGFVNKVRNRANLSNLSSSISKSDLMKEIQHQRICELADEGSRWYDLVRWGGNIDKSMTIKQVLVAHDQLGGQNFVAGKHEYLPIPQSELQTNTKIKQNNGY